MTYWKFHLFLVLPAIAVLLYLVTRTHHRTFNGIKTGFLTIVIAALIYTAPWDNYLVGHHIWSYAPDHVTLSLRLGYVPLEEYCFFILQPILTGLFLLYFAQLHRRTVSSWLSARSQDSAPRLIGGGIAMAATVLGVACYLVSPRGAYFGLILMWAGPVVAFHWFYGGAYLWRIRRVFLAAMLVATFYLCVIDRIAIEWRIWTISPLYSTSWFILGLPFEEAVFFVVTNLLVIQGMLLFFRYKGPVETSPAS